MNVLITGAAGFIGLHLTRALVEKGHRVRGLLMPQENSDELSELGVEIFRGNLTRPTTLSDIARNVDIVFHLAEPGFTGPGHAKDQKMGGDELPFIGLQRRPQPCR